MVRKHFARPALLALIAVLGWATPASADVKVSVDRDAVHLNESLALTVETDLAVEGQPDFSPLEEDFDILSQSRGSNIRIFNGDYSAITTWSLELMPKRTGVLSIPSLEIAGQRSEAKKITVRPPQDTGQDADVFMETSVEPGTAYVQQQILYTLRIFLAVNPLGLQLTPLAVTGVDARIEQLGGDTEFGTTRAGKRYRVIERKFTIFPESSGDMIIEPLLLEARLSRRSTSAFGRASVTRVRSDPTSVSILAAPGDFPGATWLPATSLVLEESWSDGPPGLRVGEPVTRTIRLTAEGLAGSQLPELSPNMPSGLKHYSDKPELTDQTTAQGIAGIREQSYAIIPAAEGEFTLPSIEVPWWNTRTDRLEIARIPSRTVSVTGSPGSRAEAAPQPPPDAIQVSPAVTGTSTRAPQRSIWPWLSLVFGAGWLLTLLLWWFTRRHSPRPAATEPGPARRAARDALRKACTADRPAEAKAALLQWARAAWPDRPPVSLGALGERCGGALQAELSALSECLYGRTSKAWNGEELWRAFRHHEKSPRPPPATDGAVLEPLYRT